MYQKHRIGYRKYKSRYKGEYVDLTKTNVNVSKKSKVAKAYDKLSGFAKKHKPKVGVATRAVKGYIQGTNDGLDSALGIPKRERDFGVVTRRRRRR